MKLQKITLENIRSYQTEEVVFPEGSTLLSGDIGSGKTSILLAVEFALFGLQPGQRGSALLKNGENEGKVTIEFEVENQQVKIERTLKRSKSISQEYCAITVDDEKSEISVTEIKDKVLDLLNYPKEFAKKQNLLYKFTVYTPQEEMKQIILQDAQTRLNTLRHVFGIDKYKKILENLAILITKLREEKKVKQALTQNLEQDKSDLVSKENELETKQYNVISVEKELFLKKEERKNVEESMKTVQAKIEEKKNLEREIEKSQLTKSHKLDLIAENNKLILRIDEQIKNLELVEYEEHKITELEQTLKQIQATKEEYAKENLEVSSKISSLNLKIHDAHALKENLQHLDVCPTCLQNVESSYKANASTKLEKDIAEAKNQIETFSLQKREVEDKITKIDHEIFVLEKEIQNQQLLRVKLEELRERKKRKLEIVNVNTLLHKDVEMLEAQIANLSALIVEYKKYERVYKQKEKELQEAVHLEKLAEIKVAELKKEIEVFSRQIEEVKERLTKTKEIKKELDNLLNLEVWLTKKFSPMISLVEKSVMTKLKSDFSKVFSQWFSMLVAENFNVSLRDDFTPVIEQQDYEIDYAYLSGGERTAVALAYRLALNQVINSLLSQIKTRDFVILDEPTDGFSEAQLEKMREVLEQLNVNQLIIVSHEQKIEGFVENVIKFKKEAGVSKKVMNHGS